MKLEQNQKYQANGTLSKTESFLFSSVTIKDYLVKAGFRDVVVTGDLQKSATGIWNKPSGEYQFSKMITDRLKISKV